MTSPLRSFFAPLVAGSIMSTVLLFGSGAMQNNRVPHPADIALVWPFVLMFHAAGLVLLMPIAWTIIKRVFSDLLRSLLVTTVGSSIGVLLLLPIGVARPAFPEILFPMTCGAVSALIWYAFNRSHSEAKSNASMG